MEEDDVRMEESHPSISQQVEVLLNINDEAETSQRAIQVNSQPSQCQQNSVNTFKPNVSLPDPQTNARYDEAKRAVKAAQAALKVAATAVASICINDYLTQKTALLQQQAIKLYEEAADSLEQSRARLYETSLEHIPSLAFQTLCEFLDYKDTANLRLTSKTVLYLHRYTEDDRFKVCHISLDVNTDFPQIDSNFLMHDFQLDVNFIIKQKQHGNYAKQTREYDINFEKIDSFLFAHKDRIRRLSMDSYLCDKHIDAILNISKLQHLTLNKDLLMVYNFKDDWDQPPLHNILVKNANHFKKLDVTGVDLRALGDANYPLKNLSVLRIGEHCINWENFATSIFQVCAPNLTTIDLHASSSYVNSNFSVTTQLPKLTSVSLHKFDSGLLCSILNNCSSTIKYLNIQWIEIEPLAIPMMPELESIKMSGVSWAQIGALAPKIPNVKEMEIGKPDHGSNATPQHRGVKLLQLSVIKIWDKNHCAWIRIMWYYLFDVAPNLRYVYCCGEECMDQTRRLCQNFCKFNITVCDLESDQRYSVERLE